MRVKCTSENSLRLNSGWAGLYQNNLLSSVPEWLPTSRYVPTCFQNALGSFDLCFACPSQSTVDGAVCCFQGFLSPDCFAALLSAFPPLRRKGSAVVELLETFDNGVGSGGRLWLGAHCARCQPSLKPMDGSSGRKGSQAIQSFLPHDVRCGE